MTDSIPENPVTSEVLTGLYAVALTQRAKVTRLKAELADAEADFYAAKKAIDNNFAYVDIDSKQYHILNCKSDMAPVTEALSKVDRRMTFFGMAPCLKVGMGYLRWEDIPLKELIKKHKQRDAALRHIAKYIKRKQAQKSRHEGSANVVDTYGKASNKFT